MTRLHAAELTVLVPTLNAGTTLAATLLSLEPGRRDGMHVCIVDGGSTDDTLSLAAGQGVPVIHRAGGLYAALNAGFREAHTPWLTWINADDLLHTRSISARLGSAATADVAYGLVDYIDATGRFVHAWRSGDARDLLPLYRAGYSPLLQQGTLFRRALYDRVGGFDESFRLVGDADFWWRCLDAGAHFVEQPGPSVASFRLHPGQLSQRHKADMLTEHAEMVRRHGCAPGFWSGFAAACRFRVRNWSRYAVRCLRRRDFGGGLTVPGSYDLPAVDGNE